MEGEWHLRANPGYWGSSSPRLLVLGFSQGANQIAAAASGAFDGVAFAKMRSRLQQVLDTLRIDLEGQTIDQARSAEGRVLGAVSLIRCGLSLMKNGKLETSDTIMPKAANNPFASQVMSTCVARHLDPLPASVQTVVLLDTADTYVKGVKDLMRGRFSDYRDINDVASPLKVESGCLRHIRARQMASLVIGEAGTGRERSISGSGAAARQVVATKFLTTIVEASHRAIARER